MIRRILREEGVRGFYKGLSASYLGVTEGTIQWVLYERLKKINQATEGKGGALEWAGLLGSAGTAKCVASLITYPHEVRTYYFSCSDPVLTYNEGLTNSITTAPCQRHSKIHWSLTDSQTGNRRGRRSITIRRSQRTSDASRT